MALIGILFLQSCGQGADKQLNRDGLRKTGAEQFAQYGCKTCHSLQGEQMYGPALNDLYLSQVTVIRRGREIEVVADRKYLKRAIMEPEYEKVLEFRDRTMTRPVISRKDTELLVEYLVIINEDQSAKDKP